MVNSFLNANMSLVSSHKMPSASLSKVWFSRIAIFVSTGLAILFVGLSIGYWTYYRNSGFSKDNDGPAYYNPKLLRNLVFAED